MNPPNEQIINDYRQRINLVLNYLISNLHENPSLERLAEVACYSKYHFHRIFKAVVGETVNDYKRRLRLERAALKLIYEQKKSISDISFECGFSSMQNFSKAFKRHFKLTPSDIKTELDFRKPKSICKQIGIINLGLEKNTMGNIQVESDHTGIIDSAKDYVMAKGDAMDVTVKDMPPLIVTYIRHIGVLDPAKLLGCFEKLIQWVSSRGLYNEDTLILGVIRDLPSITPAGRCRYDACVTIPEHIKPDGEIGCQVVDGGKFAVSRCEVVNNNFHAPWYALMTDWLPFSGYHPSVPPAPYEIIRSAPNKKPTQKVNVDICLPIEAF